MMMSSCAFVYPIDWGKGGYAKLDIDAFTTLTLYSFIVNVRGSFLMTKYSLKEMKKNDYGRILLIASIAGKEVSVIHVHTLTLTHTHRAIVLLE